MTFRFPLLPHHIQMFPPWPIQCPPLPRPTARAIPPRSLFPPGPTPCRYQVTTSSRQIMYIHASRSDTHPPNPHPPLDNTSPLRRPGPPSEFSTHTPRCPLSASYLRNHIVTEPLYHTLLIVTLLDHHCHYFKSNLFTTFIPLSEALACDLYKLRT